MSDGLGPLQGIRVVEVASYISGPFAGALLADMGAEVVKVEPPQGDPFRTWGAGEAANPYFAAYNHGKRSVVLDLKTADGVRAVRSLIRRSDVLIENYRPGVMDRLGLGWADAQAVRPDLIYCSITGFGASSTTSALPAYDTVAQGYSGLASLLTGDAEGRLIGPAFCDGLAGLAASQGVLAALVRRSRTGLGERVETSLIGATLAFLADSIAVYVASGVVPGPETRPTEAQAYRFTCAEGGDVAIHLSSPEKFWTGLCAALDAPHLAADPRFRSRRSRIANRADLNAAVGSLIGRLSREDCLQRLRSHDVPAAPVNSIGEALAMPVVESLGILRRTAGDVYAGSGIVFRGAGAGAGGAVPTLGADTASVLEDSLD